MTSQQQNSSNGDVDKKLKAFVRYFVSEIETILHTYNLILEGKADDETIKKLSSICPETAGELVGSTAGRYIGALICAPEIGSEIGKVGLKKLSLWYARKRYLEKIKLIKCLIECFLRDEADFRKTLVNTAVDIFQSYERQFIQVSTDVGPEKAMQLLAKDAAHRAVNYYKNNTFTSSSLIDSVLLGKSTKVWRLSTKRRGFQMKSALNKSNEKWKTESLYNKVGLLRIDSLSNKTELYVGINGKEKPEKYGFRRQFCHEKWDDIKDKYTLYDKKKSKKCIEYKYILTSECVEESKVNILDIINNEDSNLLEDRIKSTIKELMNNIVDQLKSLEKKRKTNNEWYKMLAVVDEWLRKFADSVDVSHEIKRKVKTINVKLQTQHSVTMDKLSKIEEVIDGKTQTSKKKSIWFEVRDPNHIFMGRSDDINELHAIIHRSRESASIVSQMTCLCGPPGVGKSELAAMYVHEHIQDFDNNAVWLDAGNLFESFMRLATCELKISSTNVDGNTKGIKTIVDEVYKYICKEKCLFVFDNVESRNGVNEFLPRSVPPDHYWPHFLITTRNPKWEKGMGMKSVKELKKEEAVAMVMKGLNLQDGDQELEIQTLVEKLQSTPGAIHKAISYISDQQRIQQYYIEDYLDDYDSIIHSLI